MLRRLFKNVRDLFFRVFGGRAKKDEYISPYATREEIGLSSTGSSSKEDQGRQKNNKLNYDNSDYVDLETIKAQKKSYRLKKKTDSSKKQVAISR